MGELAGRLVEIETNQQQRTCSVQRLFQKLDEEDREALQRILSSKASTRSIHLAIRKAGYSLERQALAFHRVNRCYCFITEEGSHE